MRCRLTTPRLILRPLSPADTPAIVAALSDWEVTRWLTSVPFPYGEADARWFIEGPAADPEQAHFAIDHAGAMVGVVSVKPDLGYWLSPANHRNGLMGEAVDAALDWRFARDPSPVASGHIEGNAASRRLLLARGFKDGAVETVARRGDGTPVPVQRMSLTRDRWREYRHGTA